MPSKVITKKRLEELLKYYREYHTELWLLEKKYEERINIEREKWEVYGKIELLEELIKEVEG